MGFFDKLKNEFIDIISWDDSSGDILVWKFPRYENEIKMNAQLTVRESQQAVFLNEGQLADVFRPGLHRLSTQNMPIMTTLNGWKYGFESPFKADVLFVNTRQFVDQRWGTKNAITVTDDRFGMVELRAFGTYAYKVVDAGLFVKEVVGIDSSYSTEDINGQLRSLIVNKFTAAAGKGGLTIDKFAANIEELSQAIQDKLNVDFEAYGLKITKFIVENVSMPEELKKEIFDYSRLNKIDMQKLAQFRTANSIETAAANEGLGGAGIGVGVGVGLGNMFGNMMNNTTANMNTPPPPPPVLQYFIAVNGQQTGPYSPEQMAQMAQAGTLRRDSMVWRSGMAQWAQASTVGDLDAAFSMVPPPPPPAG